MYLLIGLEEQAGANRKSKTLSINTRHGHGMNKHNMTLNRQGLSEKGYMYIRPQGDRREANQQGSQGTGECDYTDYSTQAGGRGDRKTSHTVHVAIWNMDSALTKKARKY